MLKWDKEDTVSLCNAPLETKLHPSKGSLKAAVDTPKSRLLNFLPLACLPLPPTGLWGSGSPLDPRSSTLFRLHLFPGQSSSLFIQQVRGEATVILYFSNVKAHHLSEQTVHIFISASWLISSLSMACLSMKKMQSLLLWDDVRPCWEEKQASC